MVLLIPVQKQVAFPGMKSIQPDIRRQHGRAADGVYAVFVLCDLYQALAGLVLCQKQQNFGLEMILEDFPRNGQQRRVKKIVRAKFAAIAKGHQLVKRLGLQLLLKFLRQGDREGCKLAYDRSACLICDPAHGQKTVFYLGVGGFDGRIIQSAAHVIVPAQGIALLPGSQRIAGDHFHFLRRFRIARKLCQGKKRIVILIDMKLPAGAAILIEG